MKRRSFKQTVVATTLSDAATDTSNKTLATKSRLFKNDAASHGWNKGVIQGGLKTCEGSPKLGGMNSGGMKKFGSSG